MDSAINGIIEDAYLRKEEKVKIDSERGVNLKTMFQYRIDNPSRVRPIKRGLLNVSCLILNRKKVVLFPFLSMCAIFYTLNLIFFRSRNSTNYE